MSLSMDAFRQWILALPQVEEQPHFHLASFRVGKRILATLHEDVRQVVIKRSPAEAAEWPQLKPDLFVATAWVKQGYVAVKLDAVEPQLLFDLIEEHWQRLMPKRLLKALQRELSEQEPKT